MDSAVSIDPDSIRRAVQEMNLFKAEIETEQACPDERDDDENEVSEDDEDAQFEADRERIEKKKRAMEVAHDDARREYAKLREGRSSRGEGEFVNSDAYKDGARRIFDGKETVLAGDERKRNVSEYLGSSVESLMKKTPSGVGTKSSSSKGRSKSTVVKLTAKDLNLRFDRQTAVLEKTNVRYLLDEDFAARELRLAERKMSESNDGRPRIGLEARVKVSGRVEPQHVAVLKDAGVAVGSFIGDAIAMYADHLTKVKEA